MLLHLWTFPKRISGDFNTAHTSLQGFLQSFKAFWSVSLNFKRHQRASEGHNRVQGKSGGLAGFSKRLQGILKRFSELLFRMFQKASFEFKRSKISGETGFWKFIRHSKAFPRFSRDPQEASVQRNGTLQGGMASKHFKAFRDRSQGASVQLKGSLQRFQEIFRGLQGALKHFSRSQMI